MIIAAAGHDLLSVTTRTLEACHQPPSWQTECDAKNCPLARKVVASTIAKPGVQRESLDDAGRIRPRGRRAEDDAGLAVGMFL